MRWKEYFLVPDHRVRTISGASFEGFYYICFNQVSGGIEGIYFHAKSEKYGYLSPSSRILLTCAGFKNLTSSILKIMAARAQSSFVNND
jgi:hypothetical protein